MNGLDLSRFARKRVSATHTLQSEVLLEVDFDLDGKKDLFDASVRLHRGVDFSFACERLQLDSAFSIARSALPKPSSPEPPSLPTILLQNPQELGALQTIVSELRSGDNSFRSICRLSRRMRVELSYLDLLDLLDAAKEIILSGCQTLAHWVLIAKNASQTEPYARNIAIRLVAMNEIYNESFGECVAVNLEEIQQFIASFESSAGQGFPDSVSVFFEEVHNEFLNVRKSVSTIQPLFESILEERQNRLKKAEQLENQLDEILKPR